MLAKRAMQFNTKEDITSQLLIQRDVYNLIRYLKPPCNLGLYYQRDNIGKKYYKLKTYYLKSLIKHVKRGGILKTYNNILDDIYKYLYIKEQ